MPQSPAAMARSMINNLEAKTGKALPAWLKVVAASSLARHGQIVTYLKSEHGVTHGFANLIAHEYVSAGQCVAGDDLLAAQYKGPKAKLRPIYDAVTKLVTGLGKDVEIAPKKTCVSYRRNKQFALIQASTRDRVDLGINLHGTAPTGRLEAAGSFNAMVSHRVRLSSPADVNGELGKWLRKAYDAA